MKNEIYVKLNDAEEAVQRCCKACVDQGKNGGFMADLSHSLIQRLNTVPQVDAPIGWISTDDRLPDAEEAAFFAQFGVHEFECQVAIANASAPTVLVYYDGEFYDEITSYRVTHWAPLLKLPK